MHELIRRARLRLLNLELISQGANAFSAALIAFIVLLLLGTEILNWYWAALIPVGGVGRPAFTALTASGLRAIAPLRLWTTG